MAVTFTPDVAKLVEVAVAVETVYGTYVTPTAQFGHTAVLWGRGHQVIGGAVATGTTQPVVTHLVRGLDKPWVKLRIPFGPNSRAVLLEWLTGSALVANAWAISDYPSSWSIGINCQRNGGNDYWKFAGCRMADWKLNLTPGTWGEVEVTMLATSMVDPNTAPTTFPTLTPSLTYAPYVLKDCTFHHSATTTFSASSVLIGGLNIEAARDIITWHASEKCEPNCLVPCGISCKGTIDHMMGGDMWDEFRSIVAGEASGGFPARYLRFVLAAASQTQRFTLPVKLDIAQFDASNQAGGIPAPISWEAAGDDATPTTAIIKVQDV